VHPGYSFGDHWLSLGCFAVAVIRQPQGLDVKEMHAQVVVEDSTDVTFPAALRPD